MASKRVCLSLKHINFKSIDIVAVVSVKRLELGGEGSGRRLSDIVTTTKKCHPLKVSESILTIQEFPSVSV